MMESKTINKSSIDNRPSPIRYCCPDHPDRPGIVTRSDGSTPCWQCYLGDEAFFARFGKDFYKEKS